MGWKNSVSNVNQYLKTHWVYLLIIIIGFVVVHIVLLPFTSADLEVNLLDWFNFYEETPVKTALAEPISVYTGPYNYLLLITKKLQLFFANQLDIVINDIPMVKLITIPFELAAAYAALLIVDSLSSKDEIKNLIFPLILLHPIVLINSAFWGQCDIIYTGFLLFSFFFLLHEKNGLALVMFGLSISFKFQAMFFAPFLLLLIFRKKMKWYELFIIPMTYLIMHIPSLLAGRSLFSVVMIYFSQAGVVPVLTGNAPNIYQFIPLHHPEALVIYQIAGVVVAVLIGLIFAWIFKDSPKAKWLRVLSFTLVLMPYFLPSMLDRYFFPAELFLVLMAIFEKKFWYLPILVTTASLLVYYNSYGAVQMGWNAMPSKIAAGINSLVIILMIFSFSRDKVTVFEEVKLMEQRQ